MVEIGGYRDQFNNDNPFYKNLKLDDLRDYIKYSQ